MNSFLDRLFRAWTDANDLDQLEDRFAALYTDPVRVNGLNISLVDLAARGRALHGAFSYLRADVLQVVDDTESVAVAFVMRGRHTGPYETPFGTIQPTGSEVQIRTIDVLTITDGRISAIWVNADDLGTLRQLGWQPSGQPMTAPALPAQEWQDHSKADPVRRPRDRERCPDSTP
jgi:predicted ester cyclase